MPISLRTNIAAVPGVGARQADGFRRLGFRCVADLLRHIPLRYEHELPEQTIADALALLGAGARAEATVALAGEIGSLRSVGGRRSRIDATLEDETGTIRLIWFNSPWIR